MKKIIFTLLMLTTAIMASAQDNITVKEGRHWYSQFVRGRFGDLEYYKLEEYLSGDTVIDNHHCLKLYETCEYGPTKDKLQGAVYEENHKVYLNANNQWRLLYDFTLQPGDTVNLYWGTYMVLEVDTIETKGTLRRRMKMGPKEYPAFEGYRVEGIGSDDGFQDSDRWEVTGSRQTLQECTDNDEVIFTKDDFAKEAVSSITDVDGTTDNSAPTEVYSLNGRLLGKGKDASPLPKGMYIMKTNGRAQKVITGK